MKNRIISVFLAVIVAAGLIPLVAVTASAEGSVIDVTSEAEFAAALDMDTPVAAINIISDFTVTSDCTVQFDKNHINNYSSVVVTVKEGVTLTVGNKGAIGTFWPSYEGDWETPPLPEGRMVNNGTIIVDDGGWIDASFEENSGTIIVKDGAFATCVSENNGTVIVEGGMYLTPQGSKCVNNGVIRVGEKATMISRFGTPIINEEGGTIELYGEFMCGVLGFDGGVMLFENHGEVTGSGYVTLDYMGPEDAPMPDMDAMIERMMAQLGQTSRFENWEDIDIFVQYEVTSYEKIKSLSKDRTVAGEHVEGNMDLIFFIRGNVVVPEGESINVMSLFVVAEDASLTVNGEAELEGGIRNRSRIEVMPGGILATTMGGDIVNEGKLTLHEGAVLISQMGGSVVNLEGAEMTLDGTFYCGCIGGESGDGCWFENFGNASGKGEMILYEAAPDFLPVNDMEQLVKYTAEKFGEEKNVPEIKAGEPEDEIKWTPGDINGDDNVDNKDIVTLFRYVSGGDVSVNEYALDTNGDGAVDNKDIVTLFRYVSGGNAELSDKPYIPEK